MKRSPAKKELVGSSKEVTAVDLQQMVQDLGSALLKFGNREVTARSFPAILAKFLEGSQLHDTQIVNASTLSSETQRAVYARTMVVFAKGNRFVTSLQMESTGKVLVVWQGIQQWVDTDGLGLSSIIHLGPNGR